MKEIKHGPFEDNSFKRELCSAVILNARLDLGGSMCGMYLIFPN